MHCIFRLLYKRPAETGISAVYRPTTNNVAFNRTPHFISGRGACEWKGTLATIRTILQLLSVLRHLKQFWLLKCKLKILSERLTLHSLITFLPDRNVSTADKWDLHHYEIRYFSNILQTDKTDKSLPSHMYFGSPNSSWNIFMWPFRRQKPL